MLPRDLETTQMLLLEEVGKHLSCSRSSNWNESVRVSAGFGGTGGGHFCSPQAKCVWKGHQTCGAAFCCSSKRRSQRPWFILACWKWLHPTAQIFRETSRNPESHYGFASFCAETVTVVSVRHGKPSILLVWYFDHDRGWRFSEFMAGWNSPAHTHKMVGIVARYTNGGRLGGVWVFLWSMPLCPAGLLCE